MWRDSYGRYIAEALKKKGWEVTVERGDRLLCRKEGRFRRLPFGLGHFVPAGDMVAWGAIMELDPEDIEAGPAVH